jgi:radical SAM protein with 4Fe4S-binding SPASM domain
MSSFRRVYVEISNICNLQCSFCPEVERDKQVMTPAFFRQVLAQVAPMTDEVCLHLMGEPLGHPQLGEIVGICAELGTPVNLTTNGLLLHGERRDLMLHPIIRQLNVSVHSFEANFSGRDVTPYMDKLFKFTRVAMTERPDLYINYRLWDLVDDGTMTAENAKIRAVIEAEFGVDMHAMGVDPRRKKGYVLAGRVYVNFDSRFEWPTLAAPKRAERGTCHGLSSHIGIHADGTVVPCCLDKEAKLKLGDLKHESLADVLSGQRATAMRDGFAANRLVEDLCQKCTFIERFDRKVQRARAHPSA